MLFVVGVLLFAESLLVIAEALPGYSCPENSPCAGGSCPGAAGRYRADFIGVADRVLAGGSYCYRNLTAVSTVVCSRECLIDGRCFSFHYNWADGERRCELNRASASRFPLALAERAGTSYFGNDEPSVLQHIAAEISEDQGPLGLTDCTYVTQAQASAECQRTDQHLCYKWEIEYAIGKGYPLSTPEGAWYADHESQAVLSDTEVTYRGLQLPVPARSPGLCCSRPVSYRSPVITPHSYDLADRDGQANGCSSLAAHLCTLAELLEAYQSGYRSGYWLYCAVPNRDVSVVACSGFHSGSECFSEDRLIPNTPRPYTRAQAYCCPDRGSH